MEKLGINAQWFIAQLVSFLLLMLILQRILYKPVLNMLHARADRIRESMEYAERVKNESQRSQEAYEKQLDEARKEAQAIISAATQQGERAREEILARAQEDARQIKLKAQEEVEFERKRVTAELRQEVADLALLAAGRVLGKALDDQAHRAVVQDFLNETGKLN